MLTPQDTAVVLSAHLANSNAHRAHRDQCSQGSLSHPRGTPKQTLERVYSELLFRIPIEKCIRHAGWTTFTNCMHGEKLIIHFRHVPKVVDLSNMANRSLLGNNSDKQWTKGLRPKAVGKVCNMQHTCRLHVHRLTFSKNEYLLPNKMGMQSWKEGIPAWSGLLPQTPLWKNHFHVEYRTHLAAARS